MNSEITGLLGMLNRAGRERTRNGDILAFLNDEYTTANGGDSAGVPVCEYLAALAALAATTPDGMWMAFVQGRVWCSVSVYAPGPLVGQGSRLRLPSRVVLGRARYRRVRGEGRVEWQLRMVNGRWVTNRKVELLTDLVRARAEAPHAWTLRTDDPFPPPEPPPPPAEADLNDFAELGDDVDDGHWPDDPDLPAAAAPVAFRNRWGDPSVPEAFHVSKEVAERVLGKGDHFALSSFGDVADAIARGWVPKAA